MTRRNLTVREESWPLKEPFIISHMRQDSAEVLVVEIEENGAKGFGEAERAEAFDPALPSTAKAIESLREAIEAGLDRQALLSRLPSGNARNAIDCALWDLEAKQSGRTVAQMIGLESPHAVKTVFTLSLGSPESMAQAAERASSHGILKLKLGGAEDAQRIQAVRQAAPEAVLTVDANMAWQPDDLRQLMPLMADLGILLVEQPFAPGQDEALLSIEHLVPVAADESCLDRSSLPICLERYDLVNIKLDKAGGLTEALHLKQAALDAGMDIMVGCNVGTSMAMAPGQLLAQGAVCVDLDGPLLLSQDRLPGLRFEGNLVYPPDRELWG